jgi:hypothetical protein
LIEHRERSHGDEVYHVSERRSCLPEAKLAASMTTEAMNSPFNEEECSR